MTDIGMMIMVDDDSQPHFDQVAKGVEKAGVRIRERLPHLGTIIGVGDSSTMAAVSSIDGVQLVRPEKAFQLPPMSDAIPQ